MMSAFRNLGLSSLQVRVILLCILINMMDGFDIMAMAYVAPRLSSEWGLSPTELGTLFSAGLAGMVVGSMTAGAIADKLGRKPVILICLAIASAGSALCGLAGDQMGLVGGRFVTGLAVGGMLPCINTMVAEYASARSRALAVALMQGGFPIGAALGGIGAAGLIDQFGWPSVFFVGALLSAALILPIAIYMPESLAFLANRPARADERARLLAKCEELGDNAVGSVAAPEGSVGRLRDYGAVKWPLIIILAVFFFSVMGFYFNTSWVPKLFADRGIDSKTSILAGSALTFGGLIAALGLGWLSLKRKVVSLVVLFALASAGLSVLIGQLPPAAAMMLAGAFALGIGINATQIGIYMIVPALFPANVRAGATGFAIGVGRLGAVVGPWVAGILLSEGWSPAMLFVLMAIPYVMAAMLLIPLRHWMTH